MIDHAVPLKSCFFHRHHWIATLDTEVGVMGGTATEMMLERPQEVAMEAKGIFITNDLVDF